MTNKKAIIKSTKTKMASLGTYKKEYDKMIEIFAGLLEQYEILLLRFENGNYQVDIDCGFGESKKTNPIIRVLETLRKDILTYSDRLCLNPKALETITIEKDKKSKLATMLSEMK